ncbi:LacI family DNA-binding transcriptional regulator [Flagellimonas allohymeniacidonis]|uniref:LacI family transcriptional regulator n=1 Tax=Flagellimonas allohymeniacidonis TaxID=2517819 RepID=A0A4Q8QL77_9FLAO|nr:LacI family DNA-binding transcriptional regulator [Allomuricauda hymeniacidonis]TAI49583.1 LacI family transcriptional regulator [Allomuricauda hymeniacidonis]
MSQISLKQIAFISGYSPGTVSKALNGSREISDRTKEVIRNIANEYEYQPNISAKSLLSGRTNTIGLLMPEFSKIEYFEVMKGIEENLVKNGFKLMTHQSKRSHSNFKKVVNNFLDGSIDALIIIDKAHIPGKNIEYLDKIIERRLPICTLDLSNTNGFNENPSISTTEIVKKVATEILRHLN